MVKITQINWLSEDAKEAEVYLSDGNFNIIGFSHPFNHVVGDSINPPLYTLNAREIYRLNDEEKFLVEKKGTAFEYKLVGRVLDKNSNQMRIGGFIIEMDNVLPNDIQEGDYVSFICDRIDIY